MRSFLGDWVSGESDESIDPAESEEPDWCPSLPSERIDVIVAGKLLVLGEFFHWECLRGLQDMVVRNREKKKKMPSCVELIMLFILGCPGKWEEFEDSSSEAATDEVSGSGDDDAQEVLACYDFQTLVAPHDITLRIQAIYSTSI